MAPPEHSLDFSDTSRNMAKSWTVSWLALMVMAVGLIPAAIGGLWVYMTVTATPLHPTATDVPSVTDSDPLRSPARR
jgi:hypothetical protein